MHTTRRTVTLLALTGAAAAVPMIATGSAGAAPVVATASGADATAIQPTVDAFRADLGTNNGGGPTAAGGRREINWDGVPAGASAPNAFPGAFFSGRGALFSTPGTGLEVSGGGAPLRFGDLDASYETEFSTFSPLKLFTPLGSTLTDLRFTVPATTREATSSAVGVVLTDADRAGSALLTALDPTGAPIAAVAVPASPNHGLSFVGLRFPDGERVARLRIRSGTAPLAAGTTDSDATDVAAIDDVIYAEPVPGLVELADPQATVAADAPTVAITVRRTGDTDGAASVRLRTVDGTAKAGQDYDAIDQRVNFAAGETAQTVAVTVRHAAIAGAGEAFTATVSEPSGIAVGTTATTSVTLLPAPVAPVATPDTTAPAVSLTRLSTKVKRGGTFRFVLGSSEAGSAKLRLLKGTKAVGTVKTVSAAAGAKTIAVKVPKSAGGGAFSVRAIVTDAAGNATTKTITFRIARY